MFSVLDLVGLWLSKVSLQTTLQQGAPGPNDLAQTPLLRYFYPTELAEEKARNWSDFMAIYALSMQI
jgi:hypothetical protein